MEHKIWYKYLGKRLYNLRKESDITQAQLAEKINMSDKFLGDIERGQAKPSVNTIFLILKALNKNFDDFFV